MSEGTEGAELHALDGAAVNFGARVNSQRYALPFSSDLTFFSLTTRSIQTS